jgi:hypothetical protein
MCHTFREVFICVKRISNSVSLDIMGYRSNSDLYLGDVPFEYLLA